MSERVFSSCVGRMVEFSRYILIRFTKFLALDIVTYPSLDTSTVDSIEMCRPLTLAQGAVLHRAVLPSDARASVQERTTRGPLWMLVLLVLLISSRLMMALLSDSVLLRVPPSTEPRRQQVISTAVKHTLQPISVPWL